MAKVLKLDDNQALQLKYLLESAIDDLTPGPYSFGPGIETIHDIKVLKTLLRKVRASK